MDDHEFERERESVCVCVYGYFLSGVRNGQPDNGPLEDIKPVRHGVDSCVLFNVVS